MRELQEQNQKKKIIDFENSIAYHMKAGQAFKKAAEVLQLHVNALEAENKRLKEQSSDTQLNRPRFFSF